MPTLTTPAQYINGVVVPRMRPSFGIPDEVVVTFIKTDRDEMKGNAQEVLASLNELRGGLPKNFPDGAAYIAQVRKEMDDEWEERLKSTYAVPD